ncbi:MAG: DUF362 domain-containing protein [Promethearchaeota archaeon]
MTAEHDPKDSHEKCLTNRKRSLVKFGLVAIASTIWFTLRTGTRPSRVAYPCQQAALANMQIFKTAILASIPSIASIRSRTSLMKPALILILISAGSFFIASETFPAFFEPLQSESDDYTRVPNNMTSQSASAPEAVSALFYVKNATGLEGNLDEAIDALFNLMSSQGLHFYQTAGTPEGLIGSNDVIIIKMNGQWESRGGTNTDLIKSVINAIIDHPDGFTGEVVIADNGQGIGDLNRDLANGYLHNQSAQKVADSFASSWNVSTILWDDLRESTVDDYDEGDFADGYVRSSVWHDDTQIFVSYPKFRSPATGAYVSFKKGIWSNVTGFDTDRLKVINMPVLKSHELLGVTASVKHYMGVPQGHIVPSVDDEVPHEHFAVALGGMGTMIAETRAPVLNILDMIWVNAHPLEVSILRGPWSTYRSARFTDIIGASLDPVALDYWSAKYVLLPTAEYLDYQTYSSLDPDYEPVSQHIYYPYVQQEESFHNYLERSMNELRDSGFQVTMNESEMDVFTIELPDRPIIPIIPSTSTATGTTTTTTSTTEDPDWLELLPMLMLPISAGIIVLVAVILKQRST